MKTYAIEHERCDSRGYSNGYSTVILRISNKEFGEMTCKRLRSETEPNGRDKFYLIEEINLTNEMNENEILKRFSKWIKK